MALRTYQANIVKKMMWSYSLPGNDVVVLAQGGGKTHIIAEFVKQLDEPVLILVPNKELLEQDLDKLSACVPASQIGVYSASMNSKEVRKITIATIQSACKHPEQFTHYKVAIIDECDLLNPKNLGGMYNQFFRDIGNPKIYGLTGTPFRQDIIYKRYPSGWIDSITTTKMIIRMKPFVWARMLCVVNTKDLLDHGYLAPVVYHEHKIVGHEDIPTNKSQSDFDLEQLDEMIEKYYGEIAEYIIGLPHKSRLVFCGTIEQANTLSALIPNSVVVTSETKKKERERIVKSFKAGEIPAVLNVGIFTVGFDYPELDCIVLLRPTRSLRLHCQILGRVTRIAPGKTEGHVYDLVDNVKSLGQLADIRIEKVDNKWNVTSPAYPQGFHYAELYTYSRRK